MLDCRFAADAEALCPTEYAAWEAASQEAVRLLLQFIVGVPGVVAADVLEAHVREVYAGSKVSKAHAAHGAQK